MKFSSKDTFKQTLWDKQRCLCWVEMGYSTDKSGWDQLTCNWGGGMNTGNKGHTEAKKQTHKGV